MPIPVLRDLAPTITIEGEAYTNLLYTLTEDRELPQGCTNWGIRAVNNDGVFTSAHHFVYPPRGWVEAPGPLRRSNTDGCPYLVGDGICLATQVGDLPIWEAVATASWGAQHLLLVAFHRDDVLGAYEAKIRVARMWVETYIDGVALIQRHWRGADLRGLEMALPPNRHNQHMGEAFMAGATLEEITELLTTFPDGSVMGEYGYGRESGIEHTVLKKLFAADISIYDYRKAIRAGATSAEVLEAARANEFIKGYAECRAVGVAHADALDVMPLGWFVTHRYADLRQHGRSHAHALEEAQVAGGGDA